jgi:hypothetical protein
MLLWLHLDEGGGKKNGWMEGRKKMNMKMKKRTIVLLSIATRLLMSFPSLPLILLFVGEMAIWPLINLANLTYFPSLHHKKFMFLFFSKCRFLWKIGKSKSSLMKYYL